MQNLYFLSDLFETKLIKRLLTCIVLIFFITVSLFAQDKLKLNYDKNSNIETDSSVYKFRQKRLPELSGYRFVISDLVKDPFITTYFRSAVGLGNVLDLKTTVRGLRGDTIGVFEGDLTFVALAFEYQQAVNDWLAFRGQANIDARVSTNVASLLTSGISMIEGYQIGGIIRIWHTKRFYLSGALTWDATGITSVSPYNFVKKAVENDTLNVDDAQLVDESHSGRASIGFSLAYSPIKWAGFTMAISGGAGNPFKDKNKGIFMIGATGGVDFQNLSPVPIGVVLAYKFTTIPQTGDNTQNVSTFSINIGYSGHSDFGISLESMYQRFQQQGTDYKVNSLMHALKMRYYF